MQEQQQSYTLVTDNKVESLITMDSPEEDNTAVEYLQHITIP